MEERVLAENAALLFEKRLAKHENFGAKDAKKIEHYLADIKKFECLREPLGRICLSLSRRRHLEGAEIKILSLLNQNRKILDIPEIDERRRDYDN
ncbi:MAG: hypothetical protein PHO56_03435 [Patescibacteria group bacterium]|nr:hypothetical protein [Patescibacteria group bacterium]